MGSQTRLYYIGRQENIIYYQWRGGYYMRTKSSLDGKRFHQDPAFEKSRQRAQEFGAAAKLAADVYRLLPRELRKRGVIGRLTGWAHRGLLAGDSREAVRQELLQACGLSTPNKQPKTPIAACTCRYTKIKPEEDYSQPAVLRDERLTQAGRLLLQRWLQAGKVIVYSGGAGMSPPSK